MKSVTAIRGMFKILLLGLGVVWILGGRQSAQAQSVTWQILPFEEDSNWPAGRGSPAITNGNVVSLFGRPIRTVQVFTPPVEFLFDVLLQSRDPNASDGAFELFFMPPGQATNLNLTAYIGPFMAYRFYAQNSLDVWQYPPGSMVVPEIPYNVTTGTTYHVQMNIAANGQFTWIINGQTFVNGNASVPYGQFQVQIRSWQPSAVWLLSNFTVTTAQVSSCPDLIGTWSGPVNVANLFSGYCNTTLSLHVTDQNTNGCLLRGYLNTGNGRGKGPWGFFNPCGGWGNVPFTGTILDTTGLVLNLGIFGQASATLDMTQTPPVMKKFILLSTGGAANGSTAVGDLAQEPSGP